jgi:hypothetical protein
MSKFREEEKREKEKEKRKRGERRKKLAERSCGWLWLG